MSKATKLGTAQLRAMQIAASTGGCVAGRRGDAPWSVCNALRDRGLLEKQARDCFRLTDAGRAALAAFAQEGK